MDKNKSGFTLMEILIVASIIAVLSGTSLAIFSTYRDDRILDNQITLLTGVIELAKTKAIAGDTSHCSDSAHAYVDGYTVTVDSISQKKISMIPGCDTTPTPIVYIVPANVEYIPANFSLKFNSQNYQGGTNRYILENEITNKCKFLQIDETGLVTNGDVTCP